MLERIVAKERGNTFEWIDLVAPTTDELESVAVAHRLHPTSVKDALQPEHLPKYEVVGDVVFLIVRAFDDEAPPDADTVRELTRKVAIFVYDSFIITIHRAEQPFMADLKRRWRAKSDAGGLTSLPHALNELLRGAITSYREPLQEAQTRFETLERQTFEPRPGEAFSLHEAYVMTRSGSVYRRMLRGALDVLSKVDALPEASVPFFQDLREETESLLVQAGDLVDDVNRILQLQLALTGQAASVASQRTNEVMRVLTVFSVFFMPLNLIAGIYGMNFEHMPELHHPHAYPAVLATMALVTLAILLWFRRKGWLSRHDL